MSRILIVDDESFFLTLLSKLLSRQGFEIARAANGREALETLQADHFDLMISDISMLPVNGMELLHTARQTHADMNIIMLTGNGSIETAVEAMKEGAFDYLTKPFKVNELIRTIQHALEYQNPDLDPAACAIPLAYRHHAERIEGIVTDCPAMLTVCERIKHFAPADSAVLICGERGAGKTLVACDLHRYSPRRSAPFHTVNCAALTAPQLEEKLFGTPDTHPHSGLLETARGETVLLEQIELAPRPLQSRLLELLLHQNARRQTRSDRAGDSVRILAAAAENLETLCEQGAFDPELYQHLNTFRIDIPPLRSRHEDLLPLISQTLRRELGDEADAPRLDLEAEALLDHYAWPGNVRELEETVRHALSAAPSGIITRNALPAQIASQVGVTPPAQTLAARGEHHKARSLKAFLHHKEKELLSRLSRPPAETPPPPDPDKDPGEEKVILVHGKKALYFPPRRFGPVAP